jgi:hypothetical protein
MTPRSVEQLGQLGTTSGEHDCCAAVCDLQVPGAAAASNSSDRAVHAAGLLPILGAAQFAAVGLSQLGVWGSHAESFWQDAGMRLLRGSWHQAWSVKFWTLL